jgi:hypothetical protein
MPRVTRVYIKTALAYFVAALAVGLLNAARDLLPPLPLLGGTSPVYLHLFMVGWVTQLIAGVAYWMFPKYSRALPRGHDGLAWATYALLNAGLLLRVVAEPSILAQPESVWGSLLVASAILQWAGGLAFVANTWPRVKEK